MTSETEGKILFGYRSLLLPAAASKYLSIPNILGFKMIQSRYYGIYKIIFNRRIVLLIIHTFVVAP